MKIAGSIILFVCGVIALVGVFLPWLGDDISSISRWGVLSDYDIKDLLRFDPIYHLHKAV